jgi:hypothetical protein
MSPEQAIDYALEDFEATMSDRWAMSPDQVIERLSIEPAVREVRDKPANIREVPVEPETVREERISPAPALKRPVLRIFALGRARVERGAAPRLARLDPEVPRAAILPALTSGGPHQGADRPRALARGLLIPTP